jgi:signal transduction histidine kinase/ligand-binding sensor domain-containing protein
MMCLWVGQILSQGQRRGCVCRVVGRRRSWAGWVSALTAAGVLVFGGLVFTPYPVFCFLLRCLLSVGRLSRFWLLGLFAAGLLKAATVEIDPDWWVRNWQLHDGLPHNVVCGVVRSGDGYLWVATEHDLARFDGVAFESFDSRDFIPGLESGYRAMIASRDDGLWAALETGQFAHLKDGAVTVVEGLPKRLMVENMMEDREGRLWIGYRQGMTAMIEDGRFVPDPGASGVTGSDCAPFFAQDERGRVWCGRQGTVGIIEEGRFRSLFKLQETRTALAPGIQGGVWLCTERALYRIEGDAAPVWLMDFGVSGMIPTALLEDASGAVWIGTRRDGLFRYYAGELRRVQLTGNRIQSLMSDATGALWVGLRDGGLVQVRPRAIRVEGPESGLSDPLVQSLCEDSDGGIWVGTVEGGLFLWNEGMWTSVSGGPGWPGGRAFGVAADPEGGVLIGLRDRIVHRDRDGFYRDWLLPGGVEARRVNVIFRSTAGEWWVVLDRPSRLCRLRDGRMDVFSFPSGTGTIRALNEDASGHLWMVASKEGGGHSLFRFADERMSEESGQIGSKVRSLRFLHRGPDGTLWMGGGGSAIGRIKGGRIAWIDKASGLYEGVVSQMVADGRGWLWMGSDYGLFKVRQEELDAVADGRSDQLLSVVYLEPELRNLQGQASYSPGALRNREGELWMPMKSGLAKIDPERLSSERNPPTPLIRRVMVDRRMVALYGGVLPVAEAGVVDLKSERPLLKLPPGGDRVEFRLTALGGSGAEQTRFRHRLVGFDHAWVDVGTQRVVAYPRLGHGVYRFEVQAGGEDGTWNPHTYALALVVRPFLWETWWLRLVAGLIGGGLAIGAVRTVLLRRMQKKLALLSQQNALHRERARIARDLHDSLGNSLTKIVMLNDLAIDQRADPEKSEQTAREVSKAARDVIKSLDRTVWALDPRNDTLENMLSYLGQVAADFLRAAQVRCRLHLPHAVAHRVLPPEVRHHILMIVQEALTNVVRHAAATEVSLSAEIGQHALTFLIEDNGCGFEPAPALAGQDGLMNMHQRLKELGGTLSIVSTPGAGARLVATIPWPATSVSPSSKDV